MKWTEWRNETDRYGWARIPCKGMCRLLASWPLFVLSGKSTKQDLWQENFDREAILAWFSMGELMRLQRIKLRDPHVASNDLKWIHQALLIWKLITWKRLKFQTSAIVDRTSYCYGLQFLILKLREMVKRARRSGNSSRKDDWQQEYFCNVWGFKLKKKGLLKRASGLSTTARAVTSLLELIGH